MANETYKSEPSFTSSFTFGSTLGYTYIKSVAAKTTNTIKTMKYSRIEVSIDIIHIFNVENISTTGK